VSALTMMESAVPPINDIDVAIIMFSIMIILMIYSICMIMNFVDTTRMFMMHVQSIIDVIKNILRFFRSAVHMMMGQRMIASRSKRIFF
jgi:hypothetical protein